MFSSLIFSTFSSEESYGRGKWPKRAWKTRPIFEGKAPIRALRHGPWSWKMYQCQAGCVTVQSKLRPWWLTLIEHLCLQRYQWADRWHRLMAVTWKVLKRPIKWLVDGHWKHSSIRQRLPFVWRASFNDESTDHSVKESTFWKMSFTSFVD